MKPNTPDSRSVAEAGHGGRPAHSRAWAQLQRQARPRLPRPSGHRPLWHRGALGWNPAGHWPAEDVAEPASLPRRGSLPGRPDVRSVPFASPIPATGTHVANLKAGVRLATLFKRAKLKTVNTEKHSLLLDVLLR